MALDNNLVSIAGTALVAANGLPVQVKSGDVSIFSENDDGSLTGTPYLKSPETSPDHRLRTGRDTVLFTDSFNAVAQNTNLWSYVFATMTAAQPGAGTVNFSVVQGTTSAHGAYMRTFQHFPLIGTSAISAEFTAGMFTAPLVTNEIWLMGFGLPGSAILEPTDGVWFQLTSAGLEGFLKYNNTKTGTGIIRAFTDFTVNDLNKYVIVVGERVVEFWEDDVLLKEISIPSANGQPFLGKSVPLFMMKYNTGAVSNTNTMRVAGCCVTLYDIDTLKAFPHAQATAGMHSSVGQNGFTQGPTSANFAQAAIPTTAAGSNTALTANLPAGLAGYGVMTAQATNVAAGGDMIAASYQNPAPTVNITGRNLIITDIWVSAINTGAAVATTPTSLLWGVKYGHTAATLVTGETASFATATTHAPRGIPLGFMVAPIGTVVGGGYDRDLMRNLESPIVVRPGEFIALTVRFRVGTATASQEVSYAFAFNGYWE